jgi:hypothetical protein
MLGRIRENTANTSDLVIFSHIKNQHRDDELKIGFEFIREFRSDCFGCKFIYFRIDTEEFQTRQDLLHWEDQPIGHQNWPDNFRTKNFDKLRYDAYNRRLLYIKWVDNGYEFVLNWWYLPRE